MKTRHERGYGAACVKLRQHILRRDHYLCQACLSKRATPATDVDHKTRKADGGTDDPGNLQALCAQCHKDKTAQENGNHTVRRVGLDGYPIEE